MLLHIYFPIPICIIIYVREIASCSRSRQYLQPQMAGGASFWSYKPPTKRQPKGLSVVLYSRYNTIIGYEAWSTISLRFICITFYIPHTYCVRNTLGWPALYLAFRPSVGLSHPLNAIAFPSLQVLDWEGCFRGRIGLQLIEGVMVIPAHLKDNTGQGWCGLG